MSKDTIYREDAIEEIKEYMVKENEAISEHPDDIFKYNSGLLTAIQAVHDLPSADRLQGKWIGDKCSVCGRLLVNITDGKNKVAKNYPYCHCGADMRGKQE